MIEQPGRIVRRHDALACVSCGAAICQACEEGRGCGAGLFGRLTSRAAGEVWVLNPQRLSVGRRVVLGLDESSLLRAAVWLYGLPLLALLGGAVLGALAATGLELNEDFCALVGSLGAVTGTLLWRRRYDHQPEAFIVKGE